MPGVRLLFLSVFAHCHNSLATRNRAVRIHDGGPAGTVCLLGKTLVKKPPRLRPRGYPEIRRGPAVAAVAQGHEPETHIGVAMTWVLSISAGDVLSAASATTRCGLSTRRKVAAQVRSRA
jgi:hypothetical protein